MDDKNYYKRKGYVSNSSISYFSKSIKLFKKFIDGEIEEESKSYFDFGQWTHLKILEEDEFNATIKVYDYINPKSTQQRNFITNALKYEKVELFEDDAARLVQAYRDEYVTKESDEVVYKKAYKLFETYKTYYTYIQLAKIKTVISSNDFSNIKSIEVNLKNHKLANKLLWNDELDGLIAHNEYEIIWNWGKVPCKSLIDRLVIDHEKKIVYLVDFKTTSKLHDFNSSFYSFNYDRQLAFYEKAIRHDSFLLGINDEYRIERYIVAADTKTFDCKVFYIKDEDITEAVEYLTKIMPEIEYHFENDLWEYSKEYYEGNGAESI